LADELTRDLPFTAHTPESELAAVVERVAAKPTDAGNRQQVREARKAVDAAQAGVGGVVERIQREAKAAGGLVYPKADSLDEMRGRLHDAEATGTTVIQRYEIDDVHVTLLVPFGRQDGLSLGLESRGTATEEIYDAAGHLRTRELSPLYTSRCPGALSIARDQANEFSR
jgi:hypothetical protein